MESANCIYIYIYMGGVFVLFSMKEKRKIRIEKGRKRNASEENKYIHYCVLFDDACTNYFH